MLQFLLSGRSYCWPLFIIVLCAILQQQQSADGFTCYPSTHAVVAGNQRKRQSTSSTLHPNTAPISSALKATIEFTGESSTSIEVLMPRTTTKSTDSNDESSSIGYALPGWLLSPESDQFFLGTSNVRERPDGQWDAIQPSVDWFGLDLVPVFVMRLERSESKVSTIITEARSEMKSGRDTTTGNLVGRLMKKSTFRGGNSVMWQEMTSNKEGWVLTADLSLTLVIPLPRFLPLPPGFNSIGSRIVKVTCRKRLDSFMIDLQQAYNDWVKNQEQGL